MKNHKKIVNISHWPLLPDDFGGAKRALRLNSELAAHYDLTYYSLSFNNPLRRPEKYNDTVVNFFFLSLVTLMALPLWLLKMPYGFVFGFYLSKLYMPTKAKKAIDDADFVILEEPHLFPWLYKHFPDKQFLLNQYNVELDLENANFQTKPRWLQKIVSRNVKRMESQALKHASCITVVSTEDQERLHAIYSIDKNAMTVIPNGCEDSITVDAEKIILPKTIRQASKGKRIIMFLGSAHKPNTDSLQLIENVIAPAMINENVIFLIVGNVCGSKIGLHKNIFYVGRVDDVKEYFAASDAAINPIISGSGSNIKIFEFLGAGLPTISTTFGVRGTGLSSREVVMCNPEDFAKNITDLLNNPHRSQSLSINGKKFIKDNLTWSSLSKKYLALVEGIL